MSPKLALGQEALFKICEIFEIDQLPVKRVILDIEVDGVVTVYTEQYIGEKHFNNFLDILVHNKPKTQKTQTIQSPPEAPLQAPATVIPRCPSCGSGSTTKHASKLGSVVTYQCRNCHFIF